MPSNRPKPSLAFARPPFASLSPSSPTSAYIHLPFCAQRCAYCAFPIIVSGRTALPSFSTQQHPPPAQSHHDYVQILCREIRAVASRWQSHSNKQTPKPLSTLYLGGGTPSLLHPSLLQRVIQTLRETIGISPDAEITCEMDPATFTKHTAHAYRSLGVNRASVGAQSFDDQLLKTCRRVHTATHITQAIDALRHAGFHNVSLDLISGLPGQTIDTWRDSLHAALAMQPEHISSYDLTLEHGTLFGNKYEPGEGPLPTEAQAAEMMTLSAEILGAAGYEHYEVSNYASMGKMPVSHTQAHDVKSNSLNISPFRSRHNMAYWRNEPFYAFGLGATSVVDGYRFARPRRLRAYVEYVKGLVAEIEAGTDSVTDETLSKQIAEKFYPHVPPLSERERLEDYLINSFRLLVEGVNFEELRSFFGGLAAERLVTAIKKHSALEKQGHIVLERSKSQQVPTSVRLTEKGALIENSVLSTLLQDAVWRYPNECTTVSS